MQENIDIALLLNLELSFNKSVIGEMGTCLGPGHDHGAIYIDLLDQIYAMAEEVEISEYCVRVNKDNGRAPL
jgi:hypothetical protein